MKTLSLLIPLRLAASAVAQWTSHDIDHLSNDVVKTAGTTCHTIDSYRETEQGKANAHVGLWETFKRNDHQPASWWFSSIEEKPADASRPLAGLKVLDFTRIIAGPVLTRGLAELGASVMRVTSPSVPDASVYHPELNWGKWNTSLDLRNSHEREILRQLIMNCDVLTTSYRPNALDKFGFSANDIFNLCKTRERGIVVVRLNSYGWHGPLQARSGWQQISDAVSCFCLQLCVSVS
ncbi:CAIB BAIF family enzyme [Fusarium albosuccineum]|uniref:CAIB BAIF family enzyme n=1 Tax=Fusarium albosuccineum TaxID=1237068 RepID=A0A8H4L6I5_9HYPO|nr:CAIB BAIF family enzyme [Fusarium albosuccineum]